MLEDACVGRGQEGGGEPLGHGAAMDGAHCATAAGQCRAPPSPAQSREQISALPHKPPPKRLAEVPALGNQPWGARVQKLAPSRALDSTGRGGAANRRLHGAGSCSAPLGAVRRDRQPPTQVGARGRGKDGENKATPRPTSAACPAVPLAHPRPAQAARCPPAGAQGHPPQPPPPPAAPGSG